MCGVMRAESASRVWSAPTGRQRRVGVLRTATGGRVMPWCCVEFFERGFDGSGFTSLGDDTASGPWTVLVRSLTCAVR